MLELPPLQIPFFGRVESSTSIGYFNSEALSDTSGKGLGRTRWAKSFIPSPSQAFFFFKSSLAGTILKVTQNQQPYCGSAGL